MTPGIASLCKRNANSWIHTSVGCWTKCLCSRCSGYGQQSAADMLAAFSGNAYMEGLLGQQQQQQQQQQMQAVRQHSSELPDPGEWDPGFRWGRV
jgi:hypothetical protein